MISFSIAAVMHVEVSLTVCPTEVCSQGLCIDCCTVGHRGLCCRSQRRAGARLLAPALC